MKNGIEVLSLFPKRLFAEDEASSTDVVEQIIKKNAKGLKNIILYEENNLSPAIEKIKEIGVDFIFYGSEREISVADKLAGELCPEYANSAETSEYRSNKSFANNILQKHGFIIPKSMLANR